MKFEFDELMTDGQVQELAARLVERNEDFAIKIARAIEVADMDRFYVQREQAQVDIDIAFEAGHPSVELKD